MSHTVAIAGSTSRTVQCIEALYESHGWDVLWTLTPEDKPVGRSQALTASPVKKWAKNTHTPFVEVSKSLAPLEESLRELPQPDILLVVDFGYLVPQWLLKLPKIKALNIHPSALPKWRGSSPGQFVLLYGESNSAVSLIEMTTALDAGNIVTSLTFTVEPNWTSAEYYHHAFKLIAEKLPEILTTYCTNPGATTPQPKTSPTPIARRLSKQDSYIPWNTLHAATTGIPKLSDEMIQSLPALLQESVKNFSSPAQAFEAAIRAFSPWPQVWTEIQTQKGPQRMKIITASVQESKLILETVQREGKTPTSWSECKSILVSDSE